MACFSLTIVPVCTPFRGRFVIEATQQAYILYKYIINWSPVLSSFIAKVF